MPIVLKVMFVFNGMSVTFSSGKLYIGSILALFFDNKLEFSDIKIAIGQGFR